jgi:hypothetical protein
MHFTSEYEGAYQPEEVRAYWLLPKAPKCARAQSESPRANMGGAIPAF